MHVQNPDPLVLKDIVVPGFFPYLHLCRSGPGPYQKQEDQRNEGIKGSLKLHDFFYECRKKTSRCSSFSTTWAWNSRRRHPIPVGWHALLMRRGKQVAVKRF